MLDHEALPVPWRRIGRAYGAVQVQQTVPGQRQEYHEVLLVLLIGVFHFSRERRRAQTPFLSIDRACTVEQG